jgi:hypothetical protein
LLGEGGRRRDVDDQRHLALLAHLRHRQGGGGIERPHDAVDAVVDDPFALIAGDVRIGFDVDEIDPVAVIGQHLGGDEGTAVTALPGGRQIAGPRQHNRDSERFRLGAHDRGGERHRAGGRGAGQHAAPCRPGGALMCHRGASVGFCPMVRGSSQRAQAAKRLMAAQ